MNTANLQLKGVLLALHSVLDLLRTKGVLDQIEIEKALKEAERMASMEGQERNELSKANLEAINFPIRFLREANKTAGEATFSAITQLVAERPDGADGVPENDV